MKKHEPFRFVAALVTEAYPGLIDIVHKSRKAGVQHIVEKVGNQIQDHALCGVALTEIQAQVEGAQSFTVYMLRDKNLPVCYGCVKPYKASEYSQYRRFVTSNL